MSGDDAADDAAAADGGNGDSVSRIYVGNLIPKANELHLKALFTRFGVIHNIWVARKPPGFAFVNYESPECARRAVEAFEIVKDGAHAMEILGKPVKVQMAGEKSKKKTADAAAAPIQADTSSSSTESKKSAASAKDIPEQTRGATRKENGADKQGWKQQKQQKQESSPKQKRVSRVEKPKPQDTRQLALQRAAISLGIERQNAAETAVR